MRSRCCNAIRKNYRKIPLLYDNPIDTDNLYVDVYILDKPANMFANTEKKGERRRGIEVVNDYHKLVIVGKPGSGKTTFLRYIALTCCKEDEENFLSGYIPFLVELRNIDANNFNLLNEIFVEFKRQLTEQETEDILAQGKVLILLDGLDEVASEYRQKIKREISKFSKRYFDNRFIITCRTQIRESHLDNDQFNYIEIADFNLDQVRHFANNWFSRIDESAELFIGELSSEENKPIAKLAVTPILLNLICFFFTKRNKFSAQRSELYKEGIELLLEEWDDRRSIERISDNEFHRIMSVDDKRKLLSYIAFNKFKTQEYASFKESELQNFIVQYIQSQYNQNISPRDAKIFLKTIEAQHGLLVEIANGTYSFSHITFQEFLTAQHISEEPSLVKELIKNHLTDSRWREVFLLLAELKQADDLLLAMEEQIQKLVDTPKLKSLLTWAEQITDPSETDIKPVAKRAIAFHFFLALAEPLVKCEALCLIDTQALDKQAAEPRVFALDYARDYALALVESLVKDNNLVLIAQGLSQGLLVPPALAYYVYAFFPETDKDDFSDELLSSDFLDYFKRINKLEIYQTIDFNELRNKLNKLQTKISDKNLSSEIYRDFARKIIPIVLKGFHLTTKMINLSEKEAKLLENYFYANLLMVECKKAAVGVSTKTWNTIEELMLRPRKSDRTKCKLAFLLRSHLFNI